jgi:hypothetical protein
MCVHPTSSKNLCGIDHELVIMPFLPMVYWGRVMGVGPYYRLISHDELKQSHQQWVEEVLKQSKIVRETKWTQSIAVGDKSFME